jgi:hypothetical protein
MIRQSEALIMGNEILKKHSLLQAGWKIQFNKSSKYLAACWYQSKVIAVSVHLLNGADEGTYSNTMLHEVAHALVGPGQGHNNVWKAKAIEIGCDGEPCGHFTIDATRNVSAAEQRPKIHIAPLTKNCPVCNATAVEVTRATFPNGKIFLKLKCGHLVEKGTIKEPKDAFIEWESSSGKKLYPYQIEGARFLESSNGRALIADEPGLGKTAQALSFVKHHADIALPALWVCKTKLKIQAAKEFLDWCGIEYFPCIIDSSRSYIMEGMKMYVVSMDLLRRLPREKIASLGIKTLIVDEIQHIKNPDSSRTQEVRAIANQVDNILFLSGTPWKNRGSEYFSALNMLDPQRFPGFAKFKNDWVEYYIDPKTGKHREGGIRHIQKFREFTKDIVIRRMRNDVLPDLPKINRSIRYVELEDIYGEEYEKAEERVAAIIKDILLEGKSFAALQDQIMILKHITGLAKVDAQVEDAIEFLEDTEDWQKITIFVHHIDVGNEVEKKLNVWLAENNFKPCLRMRGGMTAEDSNALQEKFRDEVQCRVMVASTLASGEGLNLQFCQNAYMMERQWNPANEEQAELRFSRPLNYNEYPSYLQAALFDEEHKPKPVSIRLPYLICAGTVDEILTEIVERKRINYRRAMNNGEENLKWSENEIMQELAEAIIRKRYKK